MGSRLAANPAGAPGAWSGWPSSRPPFASSGRGVTLAMIGGQRMLRDATASLLSAQDGLRVLGTFESVTQYLADGAGGRPAVLVLDCDGCGSEIPQAVATLRSAKIDSKILMLCRHISEELVRCTIAQRAGGIILKSYATEEIRAAIAYVATGRTVMPVGWQRLVAAQARERLEMSPRQREILALIAEGRCTQEIAAQLDLSPNTVKFHIRALYARLGVRNRVEAANKHAQMTSGGG
ncbi:MAG TPA: response regulator transcription factor [Solirubrobacteraceae bacterium]|nr:response regulator transcription factor [Solirubrobacteraceae bacterium]